MILSFLGKGERRVPGYSGWSSQPNQDLPCIEAPCDTSTGKLQATEYENRLFQQPV